MFPWITKLLGGNIDQTPWLHSLTQAVAAAVGKPELAPEGALERLGHVTATQLLIMDVILRRRSYVYELDRPAPIAAQIAATDAGSNGAATFLLTAACHHDGFNRERALRALAWYPSAMGCAAALLRSDDWVPQVRDAAAECLRAYAQGNRAEHLFSQLDLILLLRNRQRFEGEWSTWIEPVLLAPEHREARRGALSRGGASTRRFAYQLALRADPADAAATVDGALRDLAPSVALWALPVAQSRFDSAGLRPRLQTALGHPSAAVRAEAIRRYAAGPYDDASEVLRVALFDRANAPRVVAAYELANRFGESPLPYWRAALDASRHEVIATLALSDVAQLEDVPRLRRRLAHPQPRVRATTLRGVARLAAPGLAGFLERGLQDRAARVVLLTLRLYARGLEPLTRDRLTAALRVQPAVPARRALYSASAQLPKWEGLEFLLDECASASEEDLNPLDAALGTWLARINERFSPLNPDMAQILRAALQLARRRFESKHWDRLLALLVEA